ncbi:hypothetical protein CTI12_AA272050 [Artemisia annua]|uniref:Uncharacterized protein n=1 Tax=Artemisia annua TaxID=35608 RepID=A0A2U1NFV7_ARTAN|nr:hypothetical protein CTI12_AA272050 [Artemisia annua]
MVLNDTKEAMPWVGLYIAGASLACTLAMAADAFLGIRKWKLWFPNKFFALNTVSISLIAIAMKLPVDLSAEVPNDTDTKVVSIIFLVVMLANFLPSLGLMDEKELLVNMIAWGILLITITVNILIQSLAKMLHSVFFFLVLFPLLLVFSIALTVPASRRILEQKYKELHQLASYPQDIKFSSEELEHNVKKYWMMAETGNPQFLIACSEISSAFGVICIVFVFRSLLLLNSIFEYCRYEASDYKWSIKVIIIVQLFGIVVGSIAPIFRYLTSISYFNLSKKLSKNHLNVFRVEKRWIKMFQVWKLSHVSSNIPGRHCKITFNFLKNVILNFCIPMQVMAVVTCKIICLVPVLFLLFMSSCWYLCKLLILFVKLLIGIFEKEAVVSHVKVRSEMEEYKAYVLQIEDDVKLSKRVQKNTLNSITRLLHVSEKEKPKNLIKLLTKSKGFSGVLEFDNDKLWPLYPEEAQNSWSLVAVTLTAIAVALPNIAKDNVKGLLVSTTEGLEFVKHIEESLNVNEELVKARKASRRVGIEIEVYRTWLQSDLKKKAHKGKTSKDILEWLGDRAAKIVQSESNQNGSLDYSHENVLAAKSMYRISQTILIHCTEEKEWPTDEEIFEWVSKIIADIFLACFTNLPRVITMKCHHDAIEKRQGSIRTAARILGKSKVILNILKERQLPNLDRDSMAYLDKWHALPKSQIPEDSPSLNESLELTIM